MAFLMISEIRKHLAARPFRTFFVLTTGGNRYAVPSAEHAGVNPQGNQVVIWFDDGGSVTVPGLHIAGIELEPAPKLRRLFFNRLLVNFSKV